VFRLKYVSPKKKRLADGSTVVFYYCARTVLTAPEIAFLLTAGSIHLRLSRGSTLIGPIEWLDRSEGGRS